MERRSSGRQAPAGSGIISGETSRTAPLILADRWNREEEERVVSHPAFGSSLSKCDDASYPVFLLPQLTTEEMLRHEPSTCALAHSLLLC